MPLRTSGSAEIRARHLHATMSNTVPSWRGCWSPGMSGVGKTTVLDELRRRGHMTVDTDYDGWELYDGTWDERRMEWLLASESDVVVSGTVESQGRFYDRFEYVVLLSAPLDVLLERVSRRTNNPYGNCIEHSGRDRALPTDSRTTPAQGILTRTGRSAPRPRVGRCHRVTDRADVLTCCTSGDARQCWSLCEPTLLPM